MGDEATDAGRRISILTWSVLASCALHGLLFLPAFLSDFRPSSDGVDVEWLQSFDHLEGIGHGGGRFAKIRPPPPEPEKPPPEEEKPTEKPKEKEPEKRKVEKPREPVHREVAKKERKRPAKADEPRKAKEVFDASKDLPGLDRSGPNKLPSMEGYGPGNAVFTALLRLDRVRGTSFEEPTRRILEAVPDYRIALENTGVDPVEDLDSMFMASAQPQYIQYTFLAVRHRMTNRKLRTALDRRYHDELQWTSYHGYQTRRLVPADSKYSDPRRILLARPGLGLIVRPEHLEALTEALPEDSQIMADAGEDADHEATLIDGLEQIERAAQTKDTVVLMSAVGARIDLPGIGRFRFQGAKIRLSDPTSPDLTIDLTFPDGAQASRFADGCPRLKKTILSRVPFLARSITHMLIDRLTCRADENFVSVEGHYTADEADRVLNLAAAFVPRPPILDELPPAPPPPTPKTQPAASPSADAGFVDAGASADAAAMRSASPE